MTAAMRPNQAYDLIDPSTKKKYPFNPNRVWSFVPNSMMKMIEEGRIYFPSDVSKRPMQKRYKADLLESTNPVSSILVEVGLNTEGTKLIQELLGNKVFDYSKPLSLIKLLCMQTLDADDIVMDFFAGSNTTGQAVLELAASNEIKNISFITIQLPEIINKNTEAYKAGYSKISGIASERLRKVCKRLKKTPGFRCLKLQLSNYKAWQNIEELDINKLELEFDKFQSPLIDNWKEEDLLTEVMLMEGFPLDSKIEKDFIYKKNKVRSISSDFCEHRLLICLDKKVNVDTIKTLQLNDNDIFICLDNAIDDEQKVTLSDKGLIKTI